MKIIFYSVFLLASPLALAAVPVESSVVTCESLQEKVNQECEFSMCEDAILNGEQCIHDGDFMEGFQICAYDTFQIELEIYNNENPKSQLTCKDDEE